MLRPHDELRLEPIPASAGRARTMVARRLRGIGRDDLVDSAELAVSELVTNALLHAGAPITVRVRGTRRHPRIEVADCSMRLPRLPDALPFASASTAPPSLHGPDQREKHIVTGLTEAPSVAGSGDGELDLLETGGRGIGLVIVHSTSWGVDRSSDSKVVWFEPSPGPRADAKNEIQVFETVDGARQLPWHPPASAMESMHRVLLLDAPVRTIAALRRHYDELQREIRLIGLQYGHRASSLPRHFFAQAAHPELHRLRAIGTEQVQAAVADGLEHADLDYLVARSDAEDFAETIRLLIAADEFCRREQLLTLAMSERQLAVVRWFLGQILSQVEGVEPMPWREPARQRV